MPAGLGCCVLLGASSGECDGETAQQSPVVQALGKTRRVSAAVRKNGRCRGHPEAQEADALYSPRDSNMPCRTAQE